MKKGKKLGGKPPRGSSRWARKGRPASAPMASLELVFVVAAGLVVFGAVVGFGWAMDREIRGGILRQQTEASARPDWVPLASLPAHLPAAIIMVVDPDFLHERPAPGPRDRQTSISADLIRQVHLIPSGLTGEARALVMAPVLEQRTSKRALLELYLNRVYLGETDGFPIYGVFHAAREYFAKGPSELTLGESATLAGLLLHPRISDPQEKAGAVGVRRNEVLRVMLRSNMITEENYRTALQETLGFQPGLRDMPMSRPLNFEAEPEVIRLPPELVPRPDTIATD